MLEKEGVCQVTNYRCRVFGLLGASRPWSMKFTLAGGLSEAALSANFSAACSTLFTTAADGLQNLMTSDVTVTGTETQTLGPTMNKISATPTTLAIAGTAAGASLPWKDSALIEMSSTINTQKRFHGKVFLPPFAQSQLAADVYLAATMESVVDVFDVFFPAIHASGMQSFSYNHRLLKDLTPPYTVSFLNAYRASDKPTAQRRRVRKIVPTYYNGGAF
jgi:hypothetical protein